VFKAIQKTNTMTLSKPLYDYIMGYTEKAIKQAHADIQEAFSYQFHPTPSAHKDSVAVSVYSNDTAVDLGYGGGWGQRIPNQIPLVAILPWRYGA
jgi:hypothetical protein